MGYVHTHVTRDDGSRDSFQTFNATVRNGYVLFNGRWRKIVNGAIRVGRERFRVEVAA